MREIVDGVFELGLGFVNMHLVVTDDGVVLVDTGLPRRSKQIERALRDIRKQIGDVRTILLTHHHFDHIGSVADLRQRSGARVIAHAADAPVITGAIRAEPTGFLPRLIGRVMRAEPTKVDQLITADESEPIPGFTAVHTPGHTRGHVSYLLDRAGGVLFAGDTAGGKNGAVVSGPAQVSDDPAEQDRSIAKLATHTFEYAVFGHGGAVKGQAVDRFREYASALPGD
ncbi:MBL fold metallo-hydrolase [Paractinoplanes ferrugineus]|uniref:Hydrolase n=1 Tax=Paractinoplanes ferrugineus TaxID=113564 RepID=A0A919J3E2_9ACTN|nr:MBL fold metallo-hydrolase [Actinoplanes ferrugineus]GIE14051.1 hydrolase [Actinoplanes ferrugineus]